MRGRRSGHARPAPRTSAHTRAARAARGSSRPAAGRLAGRGGGSVGPDGSARARALMAPPGCPAALLEEPQDGQPADHRRAGGVRAAQEAGEARYAPRRRRLPRPHRIGTEAARPVCCVCRADQSREGQAVRSAGAQATAAGGDSARAWRWAAGRGGRGGGLAQPARAAARRAAAAGRCHPPGAGPQLSHAPRAHSVVALTALRGFRQSTQEAAVTPLNCVPSHSPGGCRCRVLSHSNF